MSFSSVDHLANKSKQPKVRIGTWNNQITFETFYWKRFICAQTHFTRKSVSSGIYSWGITHHLYVPHDQVQKNIGQEIIKIIAIFLLFLCGARPLAQVMGYLSVNIFYVYKLPLCKLKIFVTSYIILLDGFFRNHLTGWKFSLIW